MSTSTPTQKVTPSKPTQYIVRLGLHFPALEHIMLRWEDREFDADEFYASMGKWSRGERHLGLFLLNVWNPGYAEKNGWRFDFIDCCTTIDRDNRETLIDWIKQPNLP